MSRKQPNPPPVGVTKPNPPPAPPERTRRPERTRCPSDAEQLTDCIYDIALDLAVYRKIKDRITRTKLGMDASGVPEHTKRVYLLTECLSSLVIDDLP